MKTPVLMFPFNGNAMEAVDCLDDRYVFLGFVDDDCRKHGESVYGRVMGREAFGQYPQARVLAVPGGPSSFATRGRLLSSLGVTDDRFVSIIHPRANVSPSAKVGRNVLIMGGVWVSAGAQLGDHTCVLPNTVIHHDSVIGDYTMVGAGVIVAGGVTVGPGCYIGSGATVRHGARVAAGSLIGMAANIVADIDTPDIWIGNPARLLTRKDRG